MTLNDTVVLMNSDDYRDRFKAEYYQLSIRREKLINILAREATGTLAFEPSCSINLLGEQVAAMGRYLAILEARAEAEGIILDKEVFLHDG